MKKIGGRGFPSREAEKLIPQKTVALLKNLGQATLPQKKQEIERQILFFISVWIIASDHFFESKKVSATALSRFSSYIIKQLRGGFKKENYKIPVKARWPYYLIKNIYETINHAEINRPMFSLFKKSIGRFFHAMIKEKAFSFKKNPSFNAYIQNGRKSIGSDAALYAIGAFIFAKSFLSAREFDIIKKAIYHSSIILRLSNDLGSYERENKAGKINSLSILIKKHGLLLLDARRKILKLIKRHRESIDLYCETPNKRLKRFIKTVLRLLDFNIQLYTKQDYYDK